MESRCHSLGDEEDPSDVQTHRPCDEYFEQPELRCQRTGEGIDANLDIGCNHRVIEEPVLGTRMTNSDRPFRRRISVRRRQIHYGPVRIDHAAFDGRQPGNRRTRVQVGPLGPVDPAGCADKFAALGQL